MMAYEARVMKRRIVLEETLTLPGQPAAPTAIEQVPVPAPTDSNAPETDASVTSCEGRHPHQKFNGVSQGEASFFSEY